MNGEMPFNPGGRRYESVFSWLRLNRSRGPAPSSSKQVDWSAGDVFQHGPAKKSNLKNVEIQQFELRSAFPKKRKLKFSHGSVVTMLQVLLSRGADDFRILSAPLKKRLFLSFHYSYFNLNLLLCDSSLTSECFVLQAARPSFLSRSHPTSPRPLVLSSRC